MSSYIHLLFMYYHKPFSCFTGGLAVMLNLQISLLIIQNILFKIAVCQSLSKFNINVNDEVSLIFNVFEVINEHRTYY